MTEDRTIELMEIANRRINRFLKKKSSTKEKLYTDDLQWGNGTFEISIFKFKSDISDRVPDIKGVGSFLWAYRPDWEESDEEQLEKKIREFEREF